MTTKKTERNLTILLVDDREENLISLEMMLEADNRKFIKAGSGNEALKILLKNNDIGLIMLDVQMPDMDGFEVARILKSSPKTRDISIIFVTAINKEEHYVLKGFEEGAVDYLQKPLDVNITRAKVRVFEHLYHYQSQLRTSLLEIEKVNKQLERFSYTISHDLKSPLAGIATLLSAMEYEMDLSADPDMEKKILMMQKAVSHSCGMIEQVLQYSRNSIQHQHKERVEVHEMVSEIGRLLFPPEHIHINIVDKLPVILTQKIKLQQVFQNLISNAIKYNDKAEGIIEIGIERSKGDHCFYVKDNGPGITEDQQARLFDLFSTTTNTSVTGESSTGVGLNLLKMLVSEQGGNIWMEHNASGSGCTFFFEWPAE